MARIKRFQRRIVQPSSTAAATITVVLLLSIILAVLSQRHAPLPVFEHANVEEKKQAFFNYLSPAIEVVRAEIKSQRTRLLTIHDTLKDGKLGWWQSLQLNQLAQAYELNHEDFDTRRDLVDTLLRRVDTVPGSLALVQAAKESGWGSSRFAREGNNLFGQHCYVEGCGQMPLDRAQGRRHEAAEFDTVEAAVRAYMHNLNTHARYREFRTLRASLRREGKPLAGTLLANGLVAYSERGSPYVSEIKALIKNNNLE